MKRSIRKKIRIRPMPMQLRVRQPCRTQRAGIAAACVAVTVSICAVAAEVSFPGAGGDLAGYGTIVGAPGALRLWDTIGEDYKRVC